MQNIYRKVDKDMNRRELVAERSDVAMTVYYGNGALITKGECHAVIIDKCIGDSYLVAVVDPDTKVIGRHGDEQPFIMWARKYDKEDRPGQMKNNDAAYQKYLHLVGKLCKKRIDSKYFQNHLLHEHTVNGNGGILSDEEIKIILNYALEIYHGLIQ